MNRLIARLLIAGLTATLASAVRAAPAPNAADPAAVKEVLAGKRTDANAAWWGFHRHDSTEALQAAINSGAKRVFVPKMESDWIVLPIKLAGDQELILERGVAITAKRGEYQSGGDCVFTAEGVSNLTIRGYGATVRMHKEDYIVGLVLKDFGWNRWYGPYEKAEWRTTLAVRGCTNLKVLGLTLRDSGGDGIYVDGNGQNVCSTDIHIKDVLCDNHYRQGISIISVDGLLVEDSRFNNTWGTPPSSGVDIEPDSPKHKLKRVVFRNCRFEDNYGDGIEIFLAHQNQATDDVSILFEDCYVSSRRGAGIRVTKIADRPKGLVEFRNCTVENTQAYGIKVQDKSTIGARVRFVDCSLANVAANPNYHGTWAPIWLHPMRVGQSQELGPTKFNYAKFGGIDFVNCVIEDDHDRAAVAGERGQRNVELFDITGTITVKNPHGARADIGENQHSVTFVVKPYQDTRASSPGVKHVTVYRAPGRFGGWPANHGIWSWGNEILVGFGRGYHQDRGDSHNIDHDKPEDHLLARSTDGGETWTIEDPAAAGHLIPGEVHLFGTVREGLKTPMPTACPGGIDFTHPDFAMTLRMFSRQAGQSWFSYSYDRGKTWQGPYVLPDMGTGGVDARTNYLVDGKHSCTVFLSGVDQELSGDPKYRNRPFCARTTDGGRSWQRVSWIGPPLVGNAIMPTAARTSDARLLCVVRRRVRSQKPQAWLAGFTSPDGGRTWRQMSHPAEDTGVGNPASLIRLADDGRMCVTYGVRATPFRICAKLSTDNGANWSKEIVLRSNGGNHDIGYPRSVQRDDGKVVTVYYFWDRQRGPERYIAATIWDPDRSNR